jgi:hypothetical protein
LLALLSLEKGMAAKFGQCTTNSMQGIRYYLSLNSKIINGTIIPMPKKCSRFIYAIVINDGRI